MQLLLLHPPRNVYVACEHRCVRAHPRPCHKATEAQILGACTAWFPAHELGDPARSRVFSVQCSATLPRPVAEQGGSVGLGQVTGAGRVRGAEAIRSNYHVSQCPTATGRASERLGQALPSHTALLARGIGLGVHFRVQTRSDPVAPRLFQRCGGSSFSDLGTHAGSSALLRRYRDRRCISSANCRLVPSDRFASVVGCM